MSGPISGGGAVIRSHLQREVEGDQTQDGCVHFAAQLLCGFVLEGWGVVNQIREGDSVVSEAGSRVDAGQVTSGPVSG